MHENAQTCAKFTVEGIVAGTMSPFAEMDHVVAEGTVAASSTPENLVLNVSRLHRATVK